MIVNINQCASTYDETLHVMKFSAVAKQVGPARSMAGRRGAVTGSIGLTPRPVYRWCR